MCVPRALYDQQNQAAKPAIYLFIFKSVEHSVICVYKKVFLKQAGNELEKTIVYMVDMSPLPMSCLIIMKIATPKRPQIFCMESPFVMIAHS